MTSRISDFTNFVGTLGAPVLLSSQPAQLLGLVATNGTSSVRYLQVFNSDVVPTSGKSCVFQLALPATLGAQAQFLFQYVTPRGLHLSSGLSVGVSTASGTYTAGGATDLLVNVFYIQVF